MKLFNKLKPTRTQFISAAVLASSVGLSLAVTLPITFTSGTTAKAADVNSNFSTLATAVTTLETTVAGLVTKLGAITGTNKAQSSRTGAMGYAHITSTALGTVTLTGADNFNSSGGAVSVNRAGVGMYTVTFAGLGSTAYAGTIQVSAMGMPAACGLIGTGWGPGAVATDMQVTIDCYNPTTGAFADAPFTVLYLN